MKLGTMWSRVGSFWLAAVCGLLLAGCHLGSNNNSSEFSDLSGTNEPPPSHGDMVGVRSNTATPNSQPGSTPAVPAAEAKVGANPVAQAESSETLQAGEAITVSLSDISVQLPPMEQTVKGDGTITLWYSKTFNVAGKTRGQVEKEIHDKYVPDYWVNATVTVSHQVQSRFYYVGGEVKIPGRQVYIGRITVTRAIQSAGDFTDWANKKKVQLIRSNGEKKVINCVKALEKPELDLEVFPGDKIYVPRRIF
jgi:protein involved in polysaccharide export with SLBB domain